MAGRKKEDPLQKSVKQILKNRGTDYNEWKKEVINKKKIAVMSDEDKQWTEETIKEASYELLMENVAKDSNKVLNASANETKNY